MASGRVDLDAAEAEAAAMVVEAKVAQQEWQRKRWHWEPNGDGAAMPAGGGVLAAQLRRR